MRGYRLLIVAVGALTFLAVGNLLVYVSGARERAIRRKQKRDYYAGKVVLLALLAGALPARAQLLPEPAIPAKSKKQNRQRVDLEWMWQYGPPPAEGREHELIQDPDFRPFLDHYFLAPASLLGPRADRPEIPRPQVARQHHRRLPHHPGKVLADDNRYITVTGAVRRFRTSRGLLFADLNPSKGKAPDSLVVFAAIDWIRDSNPISDPAAQYTLCGSSPTRLPARPPRPPTCRPHSSARSPAGWPNPSPAPASSSASPPPSWSTPTAPRPPDPRTRRLCRARHTRSHTHHR